MLLVGSAQSLHDDVDMLSMSASKRGRVSSLMAEGMAVNRGCEDDEGDEEDGDEEDGAGASPTRWTGPEDARDLRVGACLISYKRLLMLLLLGRRGRPWASRTRLTMSPSCATVASGRRALMLLTSDFSFLVRFDQKDTPMLRSEGWL